jgi:hypothetical protein
MLDVRVVDNHLHIGRLMVGFHRTLRIPDDGRDYPLPPSLGRFPLHRVEDFAATVPSAWNAHGGIFLPLYQREALWLSFRIAPDWQPIALKVAMGMVNAITGKPWTESLSRSEQDYLVCPPQPWLDGMKTDAGIIRQFVAMPLGMGYTAEGQLTGQERFGGLQLVAYDPKPGRFVEPSPRREALDLMMASAVDAAAPAAGMQRALRLGSKSAEMGLGAGGRMKQQVYPDPHGVETWDTSNTGRVYVHLVNSTLYRTITGREPPPTPVDARAYSNAGYPWFDLYDEHLGDVPGSDILKGVKSIKDKDADHGFVDQQDDAPVEVQKVITYGTSDPHRVRDGSW